MAVGFGVAVGVGLGVGVGVGLGVAVGFGLGVAVAVGEGLGVAVGFGVAAGVGFGEAVGFGVALGLGVTVGVGVTVGRGPACSSSAERFSSCRARTADWQPVSSRLTRHIIIKRLFFICSAPWALDLVGICGPVGLAVMLPHKGRIGLRLFQDYVILIGYIQVLAAPEHLVGDHIGAGGAEQIIGQHPHLNAVVLADEHGVGQALGYFTLF